MTTLHRLILLAFAALLAAIAGGGTNDYRVAADRQVTSKATGEAPKSRG